MVTDEERHYMYHAFAPAEEARVNVGIRRRLAPLLGNSRRRMELMNALLFSLPGTPVIYYGDEIGMGDNIYLGDRNGVRTPMQWNADRNAGFSSAPPQRLYLPLIVDFEYHHAAVHVEVQEQNAHSLLAFMKRLLLLRKQSHAFGRGSLTFLDPDNQRILAFLREYDGERILVVANLSRFSQSVELDLKAYTGMTPVEVFGRIPFREINDEPYLLTLGPHCFYWFRLETANNLASAATDDAGQQVLPVITARDGWAETITGTDHGQLEQLLPEVLGPPTPGSGGLRTPCSTRGCWMLCRSPTRSDQHGLCRCAWLIPIATRRCTCSPSQLCLTRGTRLGPSRMRHASRAFTPTRMATQRWSMRWEKGLIDGALRWIADDAETPLQGLKGQIVVERTRGDGRLRPSLSASTTGLPADEQGSNPVFQAEHLIVKFLRRLNEGITPEWEIGRALTEQGYTHTPKVLEIWRTAVCPSRSTADDGGRARHTWPRIRGMGGTMPRECLINSLTGPPAHGIVVSHPAELTAAELLAAVGEAPPEPLAELLTDWLKFAQLLGQRTAELHHALGSLTARPAFVPEPYTPYDRRAIYQSMRGLTVRTIRRLRRPSPGMPTEERRLATSLVEREQEFYTRFQGVLQLADPGCRIRCHGDFHLGQILLTKGDVMFVDFEGESDRFLEERAPQDFAIARRGKHAALLPGRGGTNSRTSSCRTEPDRRTARIKGCVRPELDPVQAAQPISRDISEPL